MAVDDDPMVLDLIRVMLKAAPDLELVATASDGDEAVATVTAHHPDVVLMDVRMQRVGGIDVPRAMDAGSIGFILKSSARDALYAAIRVAHAGGSPMSPASAGHLRTGYLSAGGDARRSARERLGTLTPSEREIAQLIAQEQSNPAIARKLFVSESTVKQQVVAIQRKLDVEGHVGIAIVLARAE